MKKRLISTVCLWLIVLGVILFLGPTAAVFLLAVLSALTQNELYKLQKRMGYKPLRRLGLTLGFLLPLIVWFSDNPHAGSDFFVFSLILISLSILFQDIRHGMESLLIPTLFGFVYIPFMLQYYVQILKDWDVLGNTTGGLFLIVWLIAVAKFTDVGGLLVGNAIGRHKLAPHISPKKTWEGVVGGTALATAVGLALAVVFRPWMPPSFTLAKSVIIAIPISAASILSDLIESAIKRFSGQKDSGHVIPGIGGAFDLVDSLVLTAPLGYLLFKYFI